MTLIRDGRQVEIKIRLRGGQTQELAPIEVRLPRASVVRRDASPEILSELETLLEAGHTDPDVARK